VLVADDLAPTEKAEEADLFRWVGEVCGGRVLDAVPTSGGNRCRSWAIEVEDQGGNRRGVFLRYGLPRPPGAEPYTVRREADVYRAIAGADIKAPKIIAAHPRIEAILTEKASGIAEFRRLQDAGTKQAITRELMQSLAKLHQLDVSGLRLGGGGSGTRIIDHVRVELAIWRAMYEESGRRDPLLELAFNWLDRNLPDPDGSVVLTHGDAGPGNFLFEDGHLSAIIDWELAHLGDPMEDLAWFSMRCVMEPVPNFRAALNDYERFAGAKVDQTRVLYHRVFVSTRVVVIRHRNVTGEPANTIVSRALNRRLLVEALAEASGTKLPRIEPLKAPETEQSALFDHVLADLRDVIVPRSKDPQVVARAKSAAKILKFLKEVDRLGESVARAELTALADVLGFEPASVEEGLEQVTQAIQRGSMSLPQAVAYFAGAAAREAQLAASASGSIARRHYDPL
jgi:aminoglycoside phosphotransferase (APT) family kinase protein